MRAATKGKRGGQLTAADFGLLLSKLAAEPYQAGLRYERLRSRLILFFLRRLLPHPEDLADETMDRLVRRLAEGEEIASIEAYALGIARFVGREQAAVVARETVAGKEFWENILAPDITKDREALDHGSRLDAMEECIALLPPADIKLLADYYLAETGSKIEARRQLAKRNAITSAALRKKIFGISNGLRDCIQKRLSSPKSSAPHLSTANRNRLTPR